MHCSYLLDIIIDFNEGPQLRRPVVYGWGLGAHRQLANRVRPVDDPDELQQVETLSQRSDTREQGDELVLIPSRHREDERRAVAASLEDASVTGGSPRPQAKSPWSSYLA
jgi:hypothetical protein